MEYHLVNTSSESRLDGPEKLRNELLISFVWLRTKFIRDDALLSQVCRAHVLPIRIKAVGEA